MENKKSARSYRLLVTGVLVALLLGACTRPRAAKADLGKTILAANTAQYCHTRDCINPQILVVEKGYVVSTFINTKPQYSQVRAADLEGHLLGLPMSAWPRGPVITISPSDDVSDSKAVTQNFSAALDVCRALGLKVQVLPGG